jgi:hypothetical protein
MYNKYMIINAFMRFGSAKKALNLELFPIFLSQLLESESPQGSVKKYCVNCHNIYAKLILTDFN